MLGLFSSHWIKEQVCVKWHSGPGFFIKSGLVRLQRFSIWEKCEKISDTRGCDAQQSSSITFSYGDAERASSQRCTARLSGNLIYFSLSVITAERAESRRDAVQRKNTMDNCRIGNQNYRMMQSVHQQSSDWLEIIDCERMSLMPWPWSSRSRMFPSVRWSGSLKWSWGQFLINTCIATRSQPPADSLIT